jgi:hypothetical protein
LLGRGVVGLPRTRTVRPPGPSRAPSPNSNQDSLTLPAHCASNLRLPPATKSILSANSSIDYVVLPCPAHYRPIRLLLNPAPAAHPTRPSAPPANLGATHQPNSSAQTRLQLGHHSSRHSDWNRSTLPRRKAHLRSRLMTTAYTHPSCAPGLTPSPRLCRRPSSRSPSCVTQQQH